MIVRLDHIGIVASTIDEALEVLDSKLGFSLDVEATPLPDGAYFAPEGTHNYMIQVGRGETQIEVLVPVVPEAGTYKYLQRFGPGLTIGVMRATTSPRKPRAFGRRDCGRSTSAYRIQSAWRRLSFIRKRQAGSSRNSYPCVANAADA